MLSRIVMFFKLEMITIKRNIDWRVN